MGTHPIFESDFDCLTETMVSTRSRGKTDATNENAEKPKLAEPMKKKAPKAKIESTKAPKAAQLAEGDDCPDFEMKMDNGETMTLEQLQDSTFVLFYYPKDNTPGCTKENKSFNEHLEKFNEKDVKVFGVSGDSIKSHCSFIEKFDLKFNLLVDEKLALGKKLGCASAGAKRQTFLVKNGKLAKIWRKVSIPTHVESVLAEC